ncbi:hypothetical protein D3C85_435530 [compost metagenome]
MLTLFGPLNMMTDLTDPEWIHRIAQITLHKYHNEVKPSINYAIYKFEFDVAENGVSLWEQNNPYGRNFGQFREGVYFYRPEHGYEGDYPLLLSVERVTRAELVTDPTIPKIEVVIPVPDRTRFEKTDWWAEMWVEELARQYAPKWICEHYVTGRYPDKIKVTYIPATIKADQLEALHKARRLIDDLVEAINCNFQGLQRNLF